MLPAVYRIFKAADGNLSQQYLTREGLARELSVTTRTIDNWREIGGLPHYKIHGVVRFSAVEVEHWIKKNFTCTDDDPAVMRIFNEFLEWKEKQRQEKGRENSLDRRIRLMRATIKAKKGELVTQDDFFNEFDADTFTIKEEQAERAYQASIRRRERLEKELEELAEECCGSSESLYPPKEKKEA